MQSRPVLARYIDPLAHIWLHAAAELGLSVRRDPLGYAATDGNGLLTIAPDADLDADDCLAQIIFHELCHAMVQGEHSFSQRDWGLSNDVAQASYEGDTVREEACLRVQAALLRPYGLRGLLGPTTDFRSYYDALPADPLLAEDPGDPALPLAHAGLALAARAPFRRTLETALRATAQLHAALSPYGDPPVRYDAAAALHVKAPPPRLPTLWAQHPAPPRHHSGLPMHDGKFAAPAGATCGGCVFAEAPRRGKGPWRCRYASAAVEERASVSVAENAAACALYRSTLDCQQCAACCQEAYDLVPVKPREEAVRLHPQLIEKSGRLLSIRRGADRRCAALHGAAAGPYHCGIYDDRPATCRDFAAGSASCVEARRRVGLEWGRGVLFTPTAP